MSFFAWKWCRKQGYSASQHLVVVRKDYVSNNANQRSNFVNLDWGKP